ncbi:MAG TPA: hypothetical protein VMH22_15465 [bacterium]|nr:hypothetical protein [bacterium]
MLPDDNLRKRIQDIVEVGAQVESKACYEADPEFSPLSDDEQ